MTWRNANIRPQLWLVGELDEWAELVVLRVEHVRNELSSFDQNFPLISVRDGSINKTLKIVRIDTFFRL